jgi:hypothetical protein
MPARSFHIRCVLAVAPLLGAESPGLPLRVRRFGARVHGHDVGPRRSGGAPTRLHDLFVNTALAAVEFQEQRGSLGQVCLGPAIQEWLKLELGDAVDLMRDIKQAIDPLGLMNPGKIFM